jgi:hypothetical protein
VISEKPSYLFKKTKIQLNYVLRFSPHRAVNTLRLGYKNQSVNTVYWNNRCLFSDTHKIHKNKLWTCCILWQIAKFRNTTISFVVSLCSSVVVEQLYNDRKDFSKIWYFKFYRKSVKKLNFSLNFDKNNRTLHEGRYTFLNISYWIILRMRNLSHKICRENQNTHFVFSNFYFFLGYCAVCGVIWKNIAKPDLPQMTTRCKRIAGWISKYTNVHSEYVIRNGFILQQCL